jgi:hypothetical protein
MLLSFCFQSKGQVSDTSKIFHSDSVQQKLLNEIPDDAIILEIQRIHGQIISNQNYLLGYLYEEQKRIEAKLDSVLNAIQLEKINAIKKRGKSKTKQKNRKML